VYVPGVHHDNRPGTDALPFVSIQVIAVAAGNGTDREGLMRVLGVADLSSVLYGTRFDERQRVIPPELRLRFSDRRSGSGHVVVPLVLDLAISGPRELYRR
jgi:hypothetical protein